MPTVPDDAVPFLILIPIAVAADGLRRWKRHADEGRAQTVQRWNSEQAEALRRATEHERARIARELHDVVTHNVSVMVIQAGAARKVMDAAPDQAREALLAVEAGGRAAMTELRHVMGLLTHGQRRRRPGRRDGPRHRSPASTGWTRWSQRVRDAGRAGRADRVAGPPDPLPPGVDLAAYRVVQEALTNTVKHARRRGRARSPIEYATDELRVEVTDTGGTPGAVGRRRQRPGPDRPARAAGGLRRRRCTPGRGSAAATASTAADPAGGPP